MTTVSCHRVNHREKDITKSIVGRTVAVCTGANSQRGRKPPVTIRARRGCSCSGCVDGGGGETTSAHLSVPLKFVVSHHCRQSSQPPPLPFNTKTSRDKKNHYERDRPTDGVESHHTSGVPTGISSIMLRGGGYLQLDSVLTSRQSSTIDLHR